MPPGRRAARRLLVVAAMRNQATSSSRARLLLGGGACSLLLLGAVATGPAGCTEPPDADHGHGTASLEYVEETAPTPPPAGGSGIGSGSSSGDAVAVPVEPGPDVGGPPPDSDHDGVVDSVDNCVAVANADQADADVDGRGDACADEDPPPPNCDNTRYTFSASMSLSSPRHHARGDQHVVSSWWGAGTDEIEGCSRGYCSSYFRHGRTAGVKWKAYCALNDAGDRCVAKVERPTDWWLYGNNVGGSGYHSHFNIGGRLAYTCAFTDPGDGVHWTSHCGVSGEEKLEPVAAMTEWGDGVVYATGYAANHDNSNNPSIGLSAGYGGAGAFVIISSSASATYTKASAWSQPMACNAEGKPYMLNSDGNGGTYPRAGSGTGNE